MDEFLVQATLCFDAAFRKDAKKHSGKPEALEPPAASKTNTLKHKSGYDPNQKRGKDGRWIETGAENKNTANPSERKRLTSDQRIVLTDKQEVLDKTKEWEKQYEIMASARAAQDVKEANAKLEASLELARKRSLPVVDIGDSPVTNEMLRQNKVFHKDNFKILENDEGGDLVYRSSLDGRRLGYIEQKSTGFVAYNTTTKIKQGLSFATENAAKQYLRETTQMYSERNIFSTEQATKILDYGRQEESRLMKQSSIAGYSKAKVEDLTDNQWIGSTIQTEGQKSRARLIGITDKDGNLQVAAKYNLQGNNLYVDYLATAPWNFSSNDPRAVKGAGAAALAELARISQNSGKDGRIRLSALEGAQSFYEHLGFQYSKGEYSLSKANAKKLIEKYG